MSKKKRHNQKGIPQTAKKHPNESGQTIVDDWLNAETEQDRGEPPPPDMRQSGRFGGFSRLPTLLKTFLIKGWFAAAVYFFVGFGLFFENYDTWDILVGMGLLIGLFTFLISNRFLMTVDGQQRNMSRFITFKSTKWQLIFIDLVYAVVIVLLITFLYEGLNRAIITLGKLPADSVPFPAEPLGFGAFYYLIDLVFLTLRNLAVTIVKKMKDKREEQSV